MKTQIQAYRFSSKVAGLMNQGFLTAGNGTTAAPYAIGLELVNPFELLTTEALTMHFRASGMTPTNPTITQIIVQDDFNTPTVQRSIAVNITASGGVFDFTKSLGGLLNPTATGRNVIKLIFSAAVTAGTIEVWKADMLYTTKNITREPF